MQSYQSELEALIKEKMEQMEILRQIQDDIQAVIKISKYVKNHISLI